ncbi:acyl-CoA synthetase [Antrihabitans cavernicola]|uniref:Acyl-CoA synthetase n=1 Tax=Antrihabitans cavernicola TaxID=2495913 RepID=A0A5A7S9J6_9NOCA|nr:acyl-CoA synthetase [Spelaeibacter cavernicola]KAA0021253.1 acyl-CoA synthetase [Spelaeibacter cavernicola]
MRLSDIAGNDPDKLAIVMADGSRAVTFAELDARTRRLADFFAARGLRRADHIAILMGNRPEFLEVCLAAQRSGLYYTPVNWHLTEGEAAYVTDDCGAQVFVIGDDNAEIGRRVLAKCPTVATALAAGGEVPDFSSYDDVVAADRSGGSHEALEGFYFFYSSGTTGRPKGIKPTHSFPPYGNGMPIEVALHHGFGVTADSVYLCPAPLYHAAPLGWSLGVQRIGGTVVIMESFDPVACLVAIERHRITHAQFVPTMFVRMLELPAGVRARYDLSSLRVVVHAGAPCPVPVKRQMIDWLGPVLMEYYAGSEGGGMTAINSADWLAHPGSVGKPSVGTLHIVDDDGNELPAGETGNVYFGDTEMFTYHNDPEKTAAARNAKGWQTLGDLGYVDADGYLYLSDRRSDLIISGGVNIYPQEIESALIMHPDVADIAVIGVDDDEMGQSVHAVVQPHEGVTGDDELAEALLAHCRSQLAGYKCPRALTFMAELPRTPAGKLLRRRVRESISSARALP